MKEQKLSLADIPCYSSEDEDEEKIVIRNMRDALELQAELSGWSDLYLKDEIKKAVRENGFQCPSEIQKNAIPIIMEGHDLLCQARSGTGKTAVFVIGVLNRLSIINEQYNPFSCLIISHTRQLAHQIHRQFRRLAKYFTKPPLRIGCYFGGLDLDVHRKQLSNKQQPPHIIIGTPGRIRQLVEQKLLPLDKIQYFIIDECDKLMISASMLPSIKYFYQRMSYSKQVMMFSATMSQECIKRAKEFMRNQSHIFVDFGKLTLAGLQQYYVMLRDEDKLKKLMQILDTLKFNQGVIFTNRIQRAQKLTNMLLQKLFNPICIHSRLTQGQRIISYDSFRGNKYRILVATDLFGRGVDVERVNLVINYDLPYDSETYLHRVGRAGRFNTRGIGISFVCVPEDRTQDLLVRKDVEVFQEIQDRLTCKIQELPENLDSTIIM